MIKQFIITSLNGRRQLYNYITTMYMYNLADTSPVLIDTKHLMCSSACATLPADRAHHTPVTKHTLTSEPSPVLLSLTASIQSYNIGSMSQRTACADIVGFPYLKHFPDFRLQLVHAACCCPQMAPSCHSIQQVLSSHLGT